MEIRKIRKTEIEEVGAFYDECVLALTRSVNYPRWMYKEYPSVISVRAAFAEGSQYLIKRDGRIVCAFVLNTDPQGSYEKGNWTRALACGEYAVIHALAVAPDLKGAGIGREAVKYCMALAKERGYRAIRLDIVPGNIPAEKLYGSLGFTCAGTFDLDRGYAHIPAFTLYEYNIP